MDDIFVTADDFNKLFKALHFDFILEFLANIIVCIVILRIIDRFAKKWIEKQKETNTNQDGIVKFVPAIVRLLKSISIFLVVACFLQSHGYSVSSLIAGLGIGGIAIGLAAQETISNIFGTMAIFYDKAFKVGDYIILENAEGIVEDINSRSTKLRDLEHRRIIIPNGQIAKTVIKNVTSSHKRRISEIFGVTYDTSDEKLILAKEILKKICFEHKDINNDMKIFVETLDSSSINIRLIADVKTNNYFKLAEIRDFVILETIKQYRKNGIEFAFPSRTVYVNNVSKKISDEKA